MCVSPRWENKIISHSTDLSLNSAVQKPEINLLVGATGKKPIETCRATHCRETRYLIGYPLSMSGRYKTQVTVTEISSFPSLAKILFWIVIRARRHF